jgi:hypothetical protein
MNDQNDDLLLALFATTKLVDQAPPAMAAAFTARVMNDIACWEKRQQSLLLLQSLSVLSLFASLLGYFAELLVRVTQQTATFFAARMTEPTWMLVIVVIGISGCLSPWPLPDSPRVREANK